MSRLTLLPPLKFQRTSLYHDNNNIYVTTTMVGETRILSKSTIFLNELNQTILEYGPKVLNLYYHAQLI